MVRPAGYYATCCAAPSDRSVDEIASVTERLLASLPAHAPPRTREGEQERARARWKLREARMAQTAR